MLYWIQIVQICWTCAHCSLGFLFLVDRSKAWCGLRLLWPISLAWASLTAWTSLAILSWPLFSTQHFHPPNCHSLDVWLIYLYCIILDKLCRLLNENPNESLRRSMAIEIFYHCLSNNNHHAMMKITKITIFLWLMWTLSAAAGLYLHDFYAVHCSHLIGIKTSYEWVVVQAFVIKCSWGYYNTVTKSMLWLHTSHQTFGDT